MLSFTLRFFVLVEASRRLVAEIQRSDKDGVSRIAVDERLPLAPR
jgi:hypothetical protein